MRYFHNGFYFGMRDYLQMQNNQSFWDELEKSEWEKDSRRMRWVDLGLRSNNLWGTFDLMSGHNYGTMGPLCFHNGAFTTKEADDMFNREFKFNYKYYQTSYQRYDRNAISGPIYGEYEVDIPTFDDYKELIDKCSWEYSRPYSGGIAIIGKSNGNQIKFYASETNFFRDHCIGGWTTYDSKYAFCMFEEFVYGGWFKKDKWVTYFGMKENVNHVCCPVRLILRRRYQ